MSHDVTLQMEHKKQGQKRKRHMFSATELAALEKAFAESSSLKVVMPHDRLAETIFSMQGGRTAKIAKATGLSSTQITSWFAVSRPISLAVVVLLKAFVMLPCSVAVTTRAEEAAVVAVARSSVASELSVAQPHT